MALLALGLVLRLALTSAPSTEKGAANTTTYGSAMSTAAACSSPGAN